MFSKAKTNIYEYLEESKEYQNKLNNLSDKNFIEIFNEIEEIIIEKAFLEGYKEGIKETDKDHLKEKPENWLRLKDYSRLNDYIEEKC